MPILNTAPLRLLSSLCSHCRQPAPGHLRCWAGATGALQLYRASAVPHQASPHAARGPHPVDQAITPPCVKSTLARSVGARRADSPCCGTVAAMVFLGVVLDLLLPVALMLASLAACRQVNTTSARRAPAHTCLGMGCLPNPHTQQHACSAGGRPRGAKVLHYTCKLQKARSS